MGTSVVRWAEDRLVLRLTTPGRHVTCATFTHDSRQLATAHSDGTVSLWDVATGAERGRVPMPRGPDTIAVAPDGQALATHSAGVVTLWRFDEFFRPRAPGE